MEKFSKWRDPSSGIHPFLPPKSNISNDISWVYILKWYFFGPLLVLIRLPFICVAFSWLSIMMFLLSHIKLSPLVNRFLVRYVQILGCRTLLFLLGFYWIPVLFYRHSSHTSSIDKIKGGDLIICNHTSYIDVLYLAFRFSPIFVTVANDCRQDDISKI